MIVCKCRTCELNFVHLYVDVVLLVQRILELEEAIHSGTIHEGNVPSWAMHVQLKHQIQLHMHTS